MAISTSRRSTFAAPDKPTRPHRPHSTRTLYGGQEMKKHKAAWMVFVVLLVLLSPLFAPAAGAQDTPQAVNPDNKNIQAYIELLRSDLRQQKAEAMGAVMQLSAADAAKFWPVYSEYDAELRKLNDSRVANIQEYARIYSDMTDEKAD